MFNTAVRSIKRVQPSLTNIKQNLGGELSRQTVRADYTQARITVFTRLIRDRVGDRRLY